jgi:outer membrane murein-binding lipoprotein Lpp
MRQELTLSAIIYSGLFLSGCSENGPGYLFQLIFIVAPLVGLGVMLLKRTESTNDSLYILEGQIKRLSSKLENLEEKVTELTEKENKAKTKK